MSCEKCGHEAEWNGRETVQSHNIGCPASLRAHARNLVGPDLGQSLDPLAKTEPVLEPGKSQVAKTDLRNTGPSPAGKCAKGDCANPRAPRAKSGPAPKFCEDHKIKRSK